jgi:hypothetical protein
LMFFSPICCGVDMLKHVYLNTKKHLEEILIITQLLVRDIPQS